MCNGRALRWSNASPVRCGRTAAGDGPQSAASRQLSYAAPSPPPRPSGAPAAAWLRGLARAGSPAPAPPASPHSPGPCPHPSFCLPLARGLPVGPGTSRRLSLGLGAPLTPGCRRPEQRSRRRGQRGCPGPPAPPGSWVGWKARNSFGDPWIGFLDSLHRGETEAGGGLVLCPSPQHRVPWGGRGMAAGAQRPARLVLVPGPRELGSQATRGRADQGPTATPQTRGATGNADKHLPAAGTRWEESPPGAPTSRAETLRPRVVDRAHPACALRAPRAVRMLTPGAFGDRGPERPSVTCPRRKQEAAGPLGAAAWLGGVLVPRTCPGSPGGQCGAGT